MNLKECQQKLQENVERKENEKVRTGYASAMRQLQKLSYTHDRNTGKRRKREEQKK